MQNGIQKRTRSQRVAALELPPGMFDRFVDSMQRAEVLWRIAMCIVAALVMWCILGGWAPPFPYRLGYTPTRDIDAKVTFRRLDVGATAEAKRKAANQVRLCVHARRRALVQLRGAEKRGGGNRRGGKSKSLASEAVGRILPAARAAIRPRSAHDEQERDFQKFHASVDTKEERLAFGKAIDTAFADLEQRGILAKARAGSDEGNQTEIEIHPVGNPSFAPIVPVSDVLFGEAIAQLHNRLKTDLGSVDTAERVFYWLKPKLVNLKSTLKEDPDATKANKAAAEAKVADIYKTYDDGRHSPDARGDLLARADLLAKAGRPLDRPTMHLLRLEYQAELSQLTPSERLYRSVALLGMFAALFGLSGVYIFARSRSLFSSLRRFATLLALCVVTVALCKMAGDEAWMTSNEAWLDAGDAWRAELVPLLLFAMTVAIAYHQELALLLSAAMSLVVVLGLGQGLPEYVTLAQRLGDGHLFARANSQPQQVDLCRALLPASSPC